MTSRERWTIYPLLVLALGISLKDKFIPPATFKAGEIECTQLVAAQGSIGVVQGVLVGCQEFRVVDKQGKRRIAAGSVKSGTGGALDVYGASQEHAVVTLAADQDGDAGVIRTARSDGVKQVVILSTPTSGALATFSSDDRELIRLTETNGQGAVVTYDDDGNRYVLIRASISASGEPHEPPSGEQQPAEGDQSEPAGVDEPDAEPTTADPPQDEAEEPK